MSTSISTIPEKKIRFRFSSRLQKLALVLIVVGLLLSLLQWIFPWQMEVLSPIEGATKEGEGHHEGWNPRFFLSVTLALLMAIPLGLGGIYFTAFNHLAGSVWSVSLRRLAENSFWYLPVAFVLLIIVFLGSGDIFHHWVHAPSDDHLIEWKKPWLNLPFFIIRNIAFFVIWFALGFLLWKTSQKQDKDPSIAHIRRMVRYSAIFIVIFALTYSFQSWDVSMSLEPHWFSTMWAIYIFSGMALTIYASFILWVWYLKSNSYYGDSFNENHLHDLGKYLWGHSIFWAYIAVSQYMLIWYAGIPEETAFFKTRTQGAWIYVSFLLVIIRFVLPFFLLMRREAKRNFPYMAKIALLVLLGQVCDMYWIAYPTLAKNQFVLFSWQELGPLTFVLGSYIWVLGKALSSQKLIPLKDPRMDRCLHFHQ